MAILKLPGGTALSDFRLEKLNASLRAARPGVAVVATQHWHFVEAEREPSAEERRTLDRLLHYGPGAPRAEMLRGRMVLVTPRPGTISPWSSKATDIARQCGLEGLVRRVERGTAFHLGGGPEEIAAASPLLHDRMTEAVLASLDEADLLFRHVPPKPLAEIDVLARGRAAVLEANAAMGLALAPD
jgi:phosphoribosylformylglycinamidine synthase